MLYKLLKIPAQLAFLIYCRSLRVNNKKYLSAQGPLLIAANHPNSFLDAIIIATLFKRPVYSLTRGDVYSNDFYSRILSSLNMLPVYRISEGAENLEQNYETFDKCKNIFRKNGIVLIFSEGRCINEWHLRPLKKGTARLAISSWEDRINLKILPVGINYQSFLSFGKNITINFGDLIIENDIGEPNGYGKAIGRFNEILQEKIQPLVAEIDRNNDEVIKKRFGVRQGLLKKFLLIIPAIFGWAFHIILYSPIQQYAYKKASHNDHYDSMLVALLFGVYPIYLIVVAVVVSLLTSLYWGLGVFVLLPFCAWSYVQLKQQF